MNQKQFNKTIMEHNMLTGDVSIYSKIEGRLICKFNEPDLDKANKMIEMIRNAEKIGANESEEKMQAMINGLSVGHYFNG